MLSLWNMLIASRYPKDPKYIYIGLAVFMISFIQSLFILPLVIRSIWIIVKPIGKKRRAIFGNQEYDYNHFRITLCIFISVVILQVISVIICIHAVYFLFNILLNEKFIITQKENEVNLSGYIIPSTHHVLYFLEAALEAARENLLLWGFLFLVNYICKLVVKTYYFKTFALLLSIRVVFVFICSYRIPELFANTLPYNPTFYEIVSSSSPFQTLAESVRTIEVLINLLICIVFVIFLWRTIRDKLRIIEQRPDGQEASPFDTLINTLCDKTEMKRIKKYSIIYLSLLITEFILNLIQCEFPNFVYRCQHMKEGNVIILEMVFAVLADILAFILPLLTILFIVILINSLSEYRSSQNNPRDYNSLDNSEALPQESLPLVSNAQSVLKAFIINSVTIVSIAVVITILTSYIWYQPGNRVHLILKPGEYIHLNERGSQLQKFMKSCDKVLAKENVEKDFTIFNIEYKNYLITPKSCPHSNSVLFYKTIRAPEFQIQKDQKRIQELNWYPKDSYITNITSQGSISITGSYSLYPCYTEETDLTGFDVTCDNMETCRNTCVKTIRIVL
ncbi:hypothetical protein LOD99_13940 [Oopsacas minuta]|uniref:Uncharacterized protein n=1 Tax=Oopsacas minuta TaxID=111878 RepID=A0AAV7KHK9_9METZ|nr:hypothetical protein LOD99_13940 [Oopsacas minuta]